MYEKITDLDTLGRQKMRWESDLHRLIQEQLKSTENRFSEHFAGKKANKRMQDIFTRRFMDIIKTVPHNELQHHNVMVLPYLTYGMAYTPLSEVQAYFLSLPADIQKSMGEEKAFAKFEMYESFVDQSLLDEDMVENVAGDTVRLNEVLTETPAHTIIFFGAS